LDAYFGVFMLVGKFLFLGLVYWFIYWAFRGLFVEMRAESQASAAVAPAGTVAARAGAVPTPVTPPPAVAPPPAPRRVAAPVPASAPVPPPAMPALAATPAPAPPAAVVPAPVVAAPAPAARTSQPPSGMVPGPVLAALVVRDPGQSDLQAGQTINLTAATTVGRAADNGIAMHDRFASQHHAMIFLQQGQRILRDRNSTNGTFHNGRPVTEDVVLKNGDQISVGTVVFEYRSAR